MFRPLLSILFVVHVEEAAPIPPQAPVPSVVSPMHRPPTAPMPSGPDAEAVSASTLQAGKAVLFGIAENRLQHQRVGLILPKRKIEITNGDEHRIAERRDIPNQEDGAPGEAHRKKLRPV
jgi:hypothetical protein